MTYATYRLERPAQHDGQRKTTRRWSLRCALTLALMLAFSANCGRNALTGVFATRSPDRPNPLGLHPVVVRAVDSGRLLVGPIEAVDGTPVVDIKPVLC